jgi:ABC transporter substrate binding protein
VSAPVYGTCCICSRPFMALAIRSPCSQGRIAPKGDIYAKGKNDPEENSATSARCDAARPGRQRELISCAPLRFSGVRCMRRREFIALVVGAAALPLAVRAQPSAKRPTIGFLGAQTHSAMSHWVAAFVQRLSELGWSEGRVAFQYGWAEGRAERAAEIAAEFVRLKVDVIVTAGTTSVVAAKQATSVIPIVFAAAGNPVENKLVESLARPGGNVTGLSNQSTDLAGKQVELLREVVTGLGRLAILRIFPVPSPCWICVKFRQPPINLT